MPFFQEDRRLIMEKEELKEPMFVEEIVEIIRSGLSDDEIRELCYND